MPQKQKPVKPASPLALRALGKAFQSVGEKRGIETFIEAGENLLHAASDLDQPPSQVVEKSSKWIPVSVALSVVGVGLALLLGWLVEDQLTAEWWMAPIVFLLAWVPWSQESNRRDKQAQDAFFLLQEWRRSRL